MNVPHRVAILGLALAYEEQPLNILKQGFEC